jgi:hypothetical protein
MIFPVRFLPVIESICSSAFNRYSSSHFKLNEKERNWLHIKSNITELAQNS